MAAGTKWRRLFLKKPRTLKSAWVATGLALLLTVLCLAAFLEARDKAVQQDGVPIFRIGLSKTSFAGVNENDAMAAMRAWTEIILKQRGVVVQVVTSIVEKPGQIAEALKGDVDAVSMPTNEILALSSKPEFVFVPTRRDSIHERYVLLVHRKGPIADVADLRGHKLLLYNNPRMCLAPSWLSMLLGRYSAGLPETVFAGMTRIDNPSQAVLQVFFRQVDACVVTSSVFEIAGELNPQLNKELHVLATSPEVVPIVFFFRPGYSSSVKDDLEAAILALHETPAGQQVLTVFQSDRFVKQPISCLESSRQLQDKGGRSVPGGSY